MAYKKLASITQEVLATGLKPSVHRRQQPLWNTGANVMFTPNGPKKIQGWTIPCAPTSSGKPLRGGEQNVETTGSSHMYIGDLAKLYRWDGSVTLSVVNTGYTGIQHQTASAPATVWSMVPFGNWMLATNGVDVPQVVKGSALTFGALAGVSGNFTTAQIFTILNEHIIALNTSVSPYEIRWAEAGNPELWTPGAGSTAGYLTLREAVSPIVAASKIQNYVSVYTREDLFLLEYIGSTALRFRVRHALNGIGALSKQAIVAAGGLNFGVGQQGFWRTDGNTFEYIDNPDVRDFWLASVNLDQASKICGYHNEEETTVVWHYPTTGTNAENSLGIAYNYISRAWSTLSYGRTTVLERSAFDDPLAGDGSGIIYRHNNGNDDGTNALTSSILTKGLDLGDETQTKFVSGIRINYAGSGLLVRIGYGNYETGSVTYTSTKAITSGDLIPFHVAGKLIYVELSSTAVGANWEVFAADLYGRMAGMKEDQ